MKTNDIEVLLHRYFNGETSEAEEQTLRRALNGQEVPERLQADKKLFLQLSSLSAVDMPEGLERRLECLIDNCERAERANRPRPAKRHIIRRMVWGGVAACLLSGAWLGLKRLHDPYPQHDTFDNPADAYAVTRQALTLFSSTLDKGLTQISKVQTAGTILKKSLNPTSKP